MYIYNKDRKLTYLVDVWLEGTQVLCVLQIRHKYLCTVFVQLAVSKANRLHYHCLSKTLPRRMYEHTTKGYKYAVLKKA